MKYFTKEELSCKCGCGSYFITPEFEETLDSIRGFAGTPFVVLSGSRCIKHNSAVGGSNTSSHMKGLAVDIKADNSETRNKIIYALVKLGITRYGIAKTFIHFDIDYQKTQKRTWVY